MLLSNAYRPDHRVRREAEGLINAGWRVSIVCWDRATELPESENIDGIEIIRIHTVRSGYYSGWRQLFRLPRFLCKAVGVTLALRPQVVHCHDLDTLYAGWRIKKKSGCKLVFDAHEHYPALMSLYLPSLLVRALAYLEKRLLPKVDLTITASTVLRDELKERVTKSVFTLGNYSEVSSFTDIDHAQVKRVREQIAASPDKLLVGYIGGFSRNRALLPLVEAANMLPDVHFHLWGDGPQREKVEQASAQYKNVHCHGWLPDHQVPLYFRVLDIIYYGLRLDYPGAVYNAPNTLTQAMAARRPIIATDIGDLGRIVKETNCGALIEEATPKAIASAIRELSSSKKREQLGENGFSAVREFYNVENMQKELGEVYRQLLGNSSNAQDTEPQELNQGA